MGSKQLPGQASSKQAGSSKITAARSGTHVSIAALSLPPGVSGDVKGELVACVEALHWKYRQPPQQVQLRISWWGAPTGTDAVVPFHASRGAGAAFPLTSGPRFLVRYLRDMGTLSVGIEECPSGRTVGIISIDTSLVDDTRPLEASVPCLGPNKQVLATAHVSLRIKYSQLLSSFEMAEHLASADKGLPLYPLPSVTSGRTQAAAEQARMAAPSDSDSAVSTVVAGARTLAPAPAGAPGAGASGMLPRQPSSAKNTAFQHASSALAPEGLQQQQEQRLPTAGGQQKGSSPVQQPAGVAPAVDPAAAVAVHPAADPILDVIRKAEHLKASLDQAAKAGIMLALPSLPSQQQRQQQHSLLQLLQGQGCSSLLPALTGASSSSMQLPVGSQEPACLLNLPGAAGAGGSNSLLTAGELLAALAGTPGFPAGISRGAAAAPVPAGYLQLPAGQVHSRQHSGRRPKQAAATGADSSSADDECSSSGSSSHSSISSSGSHESSLLAELDGLDELEDLLLQELLNMRAPAAGAKHKKDGHHKSAHKAAVMKGGSSSKAQSAQQSPDKGQPGAAGAATEQSLQGVTATTDGQADMESSSAQQQQKGDSAGAAAPQLRFELLSLSGLPSDLLQVTAVLKCGSQQQVLDVTALAQHQQQDQDGAAHRGAGQGLIVTLAGPATLLQPLLGAQRPCLAVEVWAGQPSTSQAQLDGAAVRAPQLLGIVRVPLQSPQQHLPERLQHQACSHLGSFAGDVVSRSNTQPLADGSYPVYDVLQGKAVGTLELSVHLLPPTPAAHIPATASPDVEPKPQADGLQQGQAADGGSAFLAGADVAGVRHMIDVTLVSASGLPDAADLSGAQQPVPDKRFVKYSFPGDEPLYTQEVDCVPAPVIAAQARHTVLLQPGESVADCFAGEPGTSESLLFQVYDKWQDDSDSLAAAGSLPLQQVLDLCQPDTASSSSSSKEEDSTPRQATFLVQLVLDPSSPEAAAQPAARSVLLQVAISYTSSICYAVDNSGLLGDGTAADAAAREGGEQELPIAEQEQLQQAEHTAYPQPSEDKQWQQRPQDRAEDLKQITSVEARQYPPVFHDHPDARQLLGSPSGSPSRTNTPAEGPRVAPAAAAAAAADSKLGSAVAPKEEAAVPLTAELCVKVIRACGLQAAVREAEGWLGNASGLLGRARQLGPHPYVTVAVFPGSSSVPAVRTPFQAQTFCPQFHYQHVLPISLDGPTLTALATSEATVELWHHCPRSQAVATALARGLSSCYAMTGQQQVFLGSASLALQGLLLRPQGIRCWIMLRSQLGTSVGAVQLELCFTHIGGTQWDNSPASRPPLVRHPEWLQPLPAAPARRLSGYSVLPPPGFTGQCVRVSLHVEELLLPGGDDAALERPRIANYLATYRLPGSVAEGSTQSKACSSHAAAANLLARSWHVDWKHTSHSWAVADARLAVALLAFPLAITVHRQQPSKPSAAGGQAQGLVVQGKGQAGASSGAAVAPIGSVEVDLAPLLATRPGSNAPSCRWLSGTYPVIHPLSKSLTNTRLRLKVLLELQPTVDTPTDAWLAAHPTAHWQLAGPLAALTDLTIAQRPAPAAAAVTVAAPFPAAEAIASSTDAGHAAAGMQSTQGAQQQHQSQDTDAAAEGGLGTSLVAELLSPVAVGEASSSSHTSAAPPPLWDQQQEDAAAAAEAQVKFVTSSARLRAEVSHVSAPQGPASPGDAVAAADGSGGQAFAGEAAVSSPVPAEHQNQLMLMPAAVQGSPLQKQQLAQGLRAPAGHVQLCDVRVCVECALNLDLPDLGEGWVPALYVRYEWPDCGAVVTTPLVEATRGPLGGCQSAKWHHCMHLPLATQQQQQQQNNSAAEAASPASGGAAGGHDVTVMFQVWCRPLPEAAAAELPPLYSGLIAVPAGSDALLGCAALDLTALQLLGAVDGWYNIHDVSGQMRGQVKVSLTPPKPLAGPLQPLTQSRNSLQQVLTAWPHGPTHTRTPPGTAAPLDSSLAQLQQQLQQLQYPDLQQRQQQLQDDLSGCTATAVLQGSLDSSLMQLQQHLEHLEQLQRPGPASAHGFDFEAGYGRYGPGRQPQQQQQQQQQHADGGFQDDYADLLHELPLDSSRAFGGASAEDSAAAVEELSDAAFLALAAHSTAAAEATAAAVEAVADGVGEAVQLDSLLDIQRLRANMEELDKLSSALALRIGRSNQSDPPAGSTEPNQQPGDRVARAVAASDLAQQLPQAPSADQAPAATAADTGLMQSLRHIRTLSDDEEYLVGPANITDSEPDTDELMGRVDWSLAANSDDEHEAPPGPPSRRRHQPSHLSGSPNRPAAIQGSVLQQPLNTEDWMFDIGRSTNAAAPAAAAAAASVPGAAGSSSSSVRGSSSQVPVHPGQLSSADAEAAATAAAARLAQLDAAAARRAAAAAAAATRRDNRGDPADGCAGTIQPAAAAGASDMWHELAKVEDEDTEAGLQRTRRQRHQREREVAAVLRHLPPTAAQQQQREVHDPRQLPEALESRLDALLAEFQVQASGPGAFVGRGATGPLPQFGGYSQQAQAAAAFGRLDGGGAWHSEDYDAGGSDSSGDFLPVQRVTHESRGEAAAAAQQTIAAAEPSSSCSNWAQPDEGETLPRVIFANALPPVQEDFVLTYSDGPPCSWLEANRQPRAPQQQQQQQQENARAAAGAAVPASSAGPSSTVSQRTPGYGSTSAAQRSAPPAGCTPAAAVTAAASSAASSSAAAAAAAAPAVVSAAQAEQAPNYAFVMSTVGRRPVGGGGSGRGGPVDIMEEMFSFSRRPSSSVRSSSSSIPGGSGSIRHPGM